RRPHREVARPAGLDRPADLHRGGRAHQRPVGLAVLDAPPGGAGGRRVAFMLVANWLDNLLTALARLAPPGSFFAQDFNLRSMLALVLVSLACGAVGSLVVGGRMAFFSDALVHCAFASVSIAFVLVIFLLPRLHSTDEFWDWVTPIMLVLGMATAYGI